ncbi:integrase [Flavobacterium supellecticarium]|uniref:Integrase n=1 Tax=Flavobacterium supellecticarium TaxID=2565924 RepID=A0A4S4A0A9_9FLAO|nr:tyrosine-type recombinase/integrase [Flavobacterium supellecticarium]THF51733.1 integrase [Flavobacterium supellecticarium]
MEKIKLEDYLKQRLAEKTAQSYLFTINNFIKTNPKCKRYKFHDIINYMDEVTQKQSNTQYRIRILSAIKKYYEYLVMTGVRKDHPCKKLNIKNRSNLDIQLQDLFSSEELQLLLQRENRYWFLESRNNVLLSLLIYQGLTSEEITKLELKDIDLENGTIYIKTSNTLNGRTLELLNKQILPLSKYIDEVRPKMLRCNTDKLILNKLGKPISVDGIHSVIDPLKNLFPDRKLNPQTIRMSVICNWLNEKKYDLVKVQELAGHKWPGTTEKYIRVDVNAERELINRYFPIL